MEIDIKEDKMFILDHIMIETDYSEKLVKSFRKSSNSLIHGNFLKGRTIQV